MYVNFTFTVILNTFYLTDVHVSTFVLGTYTMTTLRHYLPIHNLNFKDVIGLNELNKLEI